MIRRFAYKCILAFATLVLLVTPSAAAPTFGITGAIYGYRYIAPGGEFLDVRGLAGIEVFDPASLGSVLLTDETGGTDPTFSVIPFGNSALLTINGSSTETGAVLFDFATPVYTSTSLRLRALGLPLSPDPSTDPALLALQGVLTFTFGLVDLTAVNPTDFLATYLLTEIVTGDVAPPGVPEPATGGLLAGAALLAWIFRGKFKQSAGQA